MAEEGWFWMLEKLWQTLEWEPSLQDTLWSASSIAQGFPRVDGSHSDAESQGILGIASLL